MINDLLKEREAQLLAITDEMRDSGDETNPILFAESAPNRFYLMTLFFDDSNGIKIQNDIELGEVSIEFFTDSDSIELTEGALYEWAINYYKENF